MNERYRQKKHLSDFASSKVATVMESDSPLRDSLLEAHKQLRKFWAVAEWEDHAQESRQYSEDYRPDHLVEWARRFGGAT